MYVNDSYTEETMNACPLCDLLELEEQAVDVLFDHIYELLEDEQYEACNTFLRQIDPQQFGANLNVSLLAITLGARAHLPYRGELVSQIRTLFEAQEPQRVDALLRGLE
jgi:hypothetical protein